MKYKSVRYEFKVCGVRQPEAVAHGKDPDVTIPSFKSHFFAENLVFLTSR
ncbi:hypothetical protein D1AOALGA4SA_8032 [Olavius algarvensis Delta 1 endosymbiont]|nr:hypothetical protein D1AOALGA4SA_8032 [Olavius algarvensis Delta 1 endosymbiont]